ncbi:MAG TPA: HAD hydrolase-like protein [Gemmatimonadaceae bacterium]
MDRDIQPTIYAERIAEHFSIHGYFERIYGSELSGERSDKTELLAHLLDREGLDPSEAWMIGDRRHDMIGGSANGTHTAGALWGYGSARELVDAGAEILIDGLGALSNHLAQPPSMRSARISPTAELP